MLVKNSKNFSPTWKYSLRHRRIISLRHGTLLRLAVAKHLVNINKALKSQTSVILHVACWSLLRSCVNGCESILENMLKIISLAQERKKNVLGNYHFSTYLGSRVPRRWCHALINVVWVLLGLEEWSCPMEIDWKFLHTILSKCAINKWRLANRWKFVCLVYNWMKRLRSRKISNQLNQLLLIFVFSFYFYFHIRSDMKQKKSRFTTTEVIVSRK